MGISLHVILIALNASCSWLFAMPTKHILEVPKLRMPPYSGHAVVVPMVFALEGSTTMHAIIILRFFYCSIVEAQDRCYWSRLDVLPCPFRNRAPAPGIK